jgi:hypothetical protein
MNCKSCQRFCDKLNDPKHGATVLNDYKRNHETIHSNKIFNGTKPQKNKDAKPQNPLINLYLKNQNKQILPIKHDQSVKQAELVNLIKQEELVESVKQEKLVESVKQEELVESVKQEELVEPISQVELVESVKQEELVEPISQEELVESVKQEELVESISQEDSIEESEESSESSDGDYNPVNNRNYIDDYSSNTFGHTGVEESLNIIEELERNSCPVITDFNKWNEGDYNEESGFHPNVNVIHKEYTIDRDQITKEYEYYLGQIKEIFEFTPVSHYGDYLSDFLHCRISCAIRNFLGKDSESEVLEKNKKYLEKSTYHLELLARLVNKEGQRIHYDFIPETLRDKIRFLFDMLITGKHTSLTDKGKISGIFDPLEIVTLFEQLSVDVTEKNQKIITNLKNFLIRMKKNTAMAWYQSFDIYQNMVGELCPMLRQIYDMDTSDLHYMKSLHEANAFIRDFYDIGEQIGIFWCLLYSIIAFLDDLLIANNPSTLEQIEFLHKVQMHWWRKHIIMMIDYAKAVVLGDDKIHERFGIEILDMASISEAIIHETVTKFEKMARHLEL